MNTVLSPIPSNNPLVWNLPLSLLQDVGTVVQQLTMCSHPLLVDKNLDNWKIKAPNLSLIKVVTIVDNNMSSISSELPKPDPVVLQSLLDPIVRTPIVLDSISTGVSACRVNLEFTFSEPPVSPFWFEVTIIPTRTLLPF